MTPRAAPRYGGYTPNLHPVQPGDIGRGAFQKATDNRAILRGGHPNSPRNPKLNGIARAFQLRHQGARLTTPGYQWDRCPQQSQTTEADPLIPMLVVIESPFAANSKHTEEQHTEYLRRCMLDALDRTEAPFASHRLYTRCLDDANDRQRKQGMLAGLAWMRRADLVAVYEDYGISGGMKWGILNARTLGIRVVRRVIGPNP